MSVIYGLVVLLADYHNDGWGHMDLDGGWWIVMMIGMILFWGLVILGIVWLVREMSGSRSRRGSGDGDSDALSVLDRRFAEGEISPKEYRERREILRKE